MKRLILPISFLLFFVLSFLSVVPHAFAADEGSIGAYPTHFDPDNPKTKSWFIYELKPGETKEDSITVVNTTEKTLGIKIYPVDATTTSDGAFALLNESQRQNDVGDWVHLAKSEISIGPKDRVDVPFTISIPKYTTVGDHAGGIIIQEAATPAASSKGMGVTIVSRVGTRIYESVPGAKVVDMDIQNLAYKMVDDHLVFTYTLVNKGNVILTPTGKFDITDGSGKKVDTIDLANLGSLFPNKPTNITTKSNITAPWFGQYTGTITLSYSPLKSIQKSIQFFIYLKDWREVLPLVLILFLILIFNLKKMFRHGKRIKTAQQAAQQGQPVPVPVGEPAAAGKPGYVMATPAADVDQAFIGRHIRLIVGLVCISILVLSLLFAFVLQTIVVPHGSAQAKPTDAVVPTQAPASSSTNSESTTPTAEQIDKSAMKVEVYNGSGTAGGAKAVADIFTKAGFTVTKTDTADELQNKTLIQYPTGKDAEANALGAALPDAYSDYKKEEASDSAVFTVTLGQQ